MPASSAILQASRRIRPVLFSSSRSIFFHPCATALSCPPTQTIPRHVSQTTGSTDAHHLNASSTNKESSFLSTAAALVALSAACALSDSRSRSRNRKSHVTTTHCQSPPPSLDGPADESKDSSSEDNKNDGGNMHIRDGMDAGSETPRPHSLMASDESAAEHDEDDDDPANDEETTCSICLINRQGPCRKYWLKFERCMKDHSEEKERREMEQRSKNEEEEVNVSERTSDDADDQTTMEEEWDRFMEKSVMPGEEDEEEEEEEDDDDDDDDEENDEDNTEDQENDHDNSIDDNNHQNNPEPSLGERCDKFMIPWISCIQEHRNVYTLISNAFYQKDYVDPLEESVPDWKRRPFTKIDATIGENEGYVVKFMGAEVDLGNWREHVEAQAEEDFSLEEEEDERERTHKRKVEEPHLINAYAKFKLIEPDTGNPIEVAYIKDQKGRLLGFDSFSKRESAPENHEDEDMMHSDREKIHDGSTMEHDKIHDGECTFHIEPGQTTSVAAYAIYKSKKLDDKGEEQREHVLYYTPHIPLPGNQSDQ